MESTDQYYQKLDISCEVVDIVNNFIPDVKWRWTRSVVYSTNFEEIVEKLFEKDLFIKSFCLQFQTQPYLYKFPAESVYVCHVDQTAGCALNMVLHEYQSHTLFYQKYLYDDEIVKTLELKYCPNNWYIFNTQRPHSIVNYGNIDRILFTMPVPKPKLYKDAVEWIRLYCDKLSC